MILLKTKLFIFYFLRACHRLVQKRRVLLSTLIAMAWCKIDVTPLLTNWSDVSFCINPSVRFWPVPLIHNVPRTIICGSAFLESVIYLCVLCWPYWFQKTPEATFSVNTAWVSNCYSNSFVLCVITHPFLNFNFILSLCSKKELFIP